MCTPTRSLSHSFTHSSRHKIEISAKRSSQIALKHAEIPHRRFGIHVNDFGPSWRDGMAFLAIVSRLKPSSVDLDAARNMSNRQRLDTAFNVAERELGIPKLIDSEGLRFH